MSPEFARVVDPVFLHIVRLLERIEKNEEISLQDERITMSGLLERLDSLATADAQLAKYALIGWIDNLLINAPWDHREEWVNNCLEVQIYGPPRKAGVDFFRKAKEAAQLTRKDALEVFYVCVLLGFRGLYADSDFGAHLTQHGLPSDLETWTRQTATQIRLGQGRSTIADFSRPGRGAPPLEGKFRFLACLTVFGILTALNIILIVYHASH